ncbi:phage tail terminator-like protein [Providencia rettgeri]|uniref:phage tail terminator-like protein n=1 Tax=Providencia rettgeri TaxID=587 RepID=UPI00236318D7|nr:phage tail terminator-like protein [Providencia rettgeri]
MKLTEIRNAIISRMTAQTAIAKKDVAYQNDKPFDSSGKAIWARLTIKSGLADAQEIGHGPIVHRTGIAFIQIFVPLATGTLLITQTADKLRELFENQTDGQLDYFSVSADDVGDEGHGWYQLNLSIPYRAL